MIPLNLQKNSVFPWAKTPSVVFLMEMGTVEDFDGASIPLCSLMYPSGRIYITLNSCSEMWPGSTLAVQPLEYRTGLRKFRAHKKPSPILTSAEDLIDKLSNLATNETGKSW